MLSARATPGKRIAHSSSRSLKLVQAFFGHASLWLGVLVRKRDIVLVRVERASIILFSTSRLFWAARCSYARSCCQIRCD